MSSQEFDGAVPVLIGDEHWLVLDQRRYLVLPYEFMPNIEIDLQTGEEKVSGISCYEHILEVDRLVGAYDDVLATTICFIDGESCAEDYYLLKQDGRLLCDYEHRKLRITRQSMPDYIIFKQVSPCSQWVSRCRKLESLNL